MLVCWRLVSRALPPTTYHCGTALRCLSFAHVWFDLRWLNGAFARRALGVHASLSVRTFKLQEFLQPPRTPPLCRTRPTGFVLRRCACRRLLPAPGRLLLGLVTMDFLW